MTYAYKVLGVTPDAKLVSRYDGSEYQIGVERVDTDKHGLSVHVTEAGAINHGIPDASSHRGLPRVVCRVVVPDDVMLERGRKTLVPRLTVLRVIRVVAEVECVRVSSAQAKGAAKAYSYWGAVRYRARLHRGWWSLIPLERASSDRRSQRLAAMDAAQIARKEGRLLVAELPSFAPAAAK